MQIVAATDEAQLLASLRPHSLAQFIGQDRVKQNLALALQGAKIRQKPPDHVLLSGNPGLGKTSLAKIIPAEIGGNLVEVVAPAIERKSDLVGILADLNPGDCLFIDEIHRLRPEFEEMLYPAMEDFRIDFIIGTGQDAKTYPIELQPFTLIGATTRKGMVSEPLRERFGLDFTLQKYELEPLTQIVKRSALLLNMPITDAAAAELARLAHGTPRIANTRLKRVQDYALVYGVQCVSVDDVYATMDILGIDEHGLDDLDRAYLRTLLKLYKGGPSGVNSIAASISEDPETLTSSVEPHLLDSGLIIRAQRGRVLTDRGKEVAANIA